MSNKLKVSIGMLPVLLSMVMSAAHAGSMGYNNSHPLSFTLVEPGTATVSVESEANLQSGTVAAKAKLATAVIKYDGSLGATATDLGVKWVEGNVGGQIDIADPRKYKLKNTATPDDVLNVVLTTDPTGNTLAVTKTAPYVGGTAGVGSDLTLYVVVDAAPQTAKPGTYNGVLQAAYLSN